MVINLQDSNLVVNYLQIFLRDTFGVTLRKAPDNTDVAQGTAYEITMNEPIKVTGVYNLQTYLSIALYMAFNYPNEGYPYRWERDSKNESAWIPYPYEPSRLLKTLETIKIDHSGYRFTSRDKTEAQKDYQEEFEEELKTPEFLDHSELLRYFVSIEQMNEYVNGIKEVTEDNVRDCLVNILVANMSTTSVNTIAAQMPERVLAYVFDEVVTPLSEMDEVFRIQKMIYYPAVPREVAGKYDKKFNGISTMDRVTQYQQEFINKYTDPKTGVVSLPESFKDFKVTGYLDPWTEFIIRSKEGDNG